jgi:hypothetical protein
MTVLETISFQLRDGVEDADFLRRNKKVETEYMRQRPGFRSRETAHGADGTWLVLVHWDNAEHADATGRVFMQAAETKEFMAAVDPATVSQGRYEIADQ